MNTIDRSHRWCEPIGSQDHANGLASTSAADTPHVNDVCRQPDDYEEKDEASPEGRAPDSVAVRMEEDERSRCSGQDEGDKKLAGRHHSGL
jgi:hypothetical protein